MPRAHPSLDLFALEPVEAPRPAPQPRPRRAQIWIAVCLPSLALECLASDVGSARPAVVVEAEQGRVQVVASNEAAAQAGVAPGMKLGTALALAASLQVFERAPARERSSLESLAEWAGSLTSLVSIEAADGLLLEVAGSLKLFGSLESIKDKLRAELAKRYRDFRLCAAPTATAALWLARAASTDVVHRRDLAGQLAGLPLAATHWPPAVQALLRDLGLRTVGDCARLPRDGFARRVGRAYLSDLDRAFDRSVDLRVEFRAPVSWSSRVELGEESVDRALFLEILEQLLDELTAELRVRQAQIKSFEIAFEHLRRAPTVESFDLRDPTHERERLLGLIEDRMERSILPFPALALRLRSGAFQPLELDDADLFDTKPVEQRAHALLERLQERFGRAAVYGLRAVAEHRPEKAWAKRFERDSHRARLAAPARRESRPLWLLPAPVALDPRRDPFELCSGPERIESGWWDGQDVARDYYTATNDHGQKLWVFRDLRSRGWFLHGLFG